jgi:cytochrome o ubiquinol oxidase operon protein cyoD
MVAGSLLVKLLAFCALIQAIVQLRYFLHLGQEAKPRYESLVFYFMAVVLIIITIGSLWIMSDLNARVMSDMTGMVHD